MLRRMQNFSREEWLRVRERGKNAYLVRSGVIGRGVPLGLICAIAIEAALGSPLPDAFTGSAFLLRAVALSAVFSVSGCLRANLSWNLHEKRHASGA